MKNRVHRVFSWIMLLILYTSSGICPVKAESNDTTIGTFLSETNALMFDLPEGWQVRLKNDLSDYGLFIMTEDSYDPAIMLITTDLWAGLNEQVKLQCRLLGYDRSDLDWLLFNPEMIANLLNKNSEIFLLWESNNRQFYLYPDVIPMDVNGRRQNVECICAYTIQDGYSFVFVLVEPSQSESNVDTFMCLLESVRLPELSPDTQ